MTDESTPVSAWHASSLHASNLRALGLPENSDPLSVWEAGVKYAQTEALAQAVAVVKAETDRLIKRNVDLERRLTSILCLAKIPR